MRATQTLWVASLYLEKKVLGMLAPTPNYPTHSYIHLKGPTPSYPTHPYMHLQALYSHPED